jgi:hypothetical protein
VPSTSVTAAAILAAFAQPTALAVVQQVLYVADALGSSIRALQLRGDLVQTLVGQGHGASVTKMARARRPACSSRRRSREPGAAAMDCRYRQWPPARCAWAVAN